MNEHGTPAGAGGCSRCSCGRGEPMMASRREFLAQTTLAAVAVFLAACGDGQIGATAPNVGGSPGGTSAGLTVRLADFPALANVGGIARVDGGTGIPVALVRTTATTFAAFSMVCPHQGTTIDIVSGGFHCPNHGANFSAAGQWTGGQSTGNLSSFPTTYDATAGTVTIAGGAGTGTGGTGGTGGGDDDGGGD